MVFLTGGLSHLDSFDMKPDAPTAFAASSIRSRRPSRESSICEHLPLLAARADKLAIVRSLSHAYTNHLNATHEILTGHPQPGAFFDKIASRDDYPCYASAVNAIRPEGDGIPSGVSLPTFLMEGPLIWPGQHAGFLGPRHDPWQVQPGPEPAGFGFDGLTLPGLSVERLDRRKSLLDRVNARFDQVGPPAAEPKDPFADQVDRAYTLLAFGQAWRGPST